MGTWAGRHAQIRMPTCLGGSIILDCLTCRSPKSREQVQAPHLEPSSCREPAGAEKVLQVTTPRAPFLQPTAGGSTSASCLQAHCFFPDTHRSLSHSILPGAQQSGCVHPTLVGPWGQQTSKACLEDAEAGGDGAPEGGDNPARSQVHSSLFQTVLLAQGTKASLQETWASP